MRVVAESLAQEGGRGTLVQLAADEVESLFAGRRILDLLVYLAPVLQDEGFEVTEDDLAAARAASHILFNLEWQATEP